MTEISGVIATTSVNRHKFDFRSRNGAPLSSLEWQTEWASGFDAKRYPDEVCEELAARGAALPDGDFDVLGAWKDGVIRRGGQRNFGKCLVYFTRGWKENAVCARTVWLSLASKRRGLEEFLDRRDYRSFLNQVADEQYLKAGRGGLSSARFGLSRATYILHVFSKARFPIYDRNTHRGISRLTHGYYNGWEIRKMKSDDADWYLERFCAIIGDLQQQCGALESASFRQVDKALFQYGKQG